MLENADDVYVAIFNYMCEQKCTPNYQKLHITKKNNSKTGKINIDIKYNIKIKLYIQERACE